MKKKRLLIIGCGDIAKRIIKLLNGRYRLYGLIRDHSKAAALRELKITPIIGDLDKPSSLTKLSGIADLILHTAPPPSSGDTDLRTTHLINALAKDGMLPQRLVYISTSGVYGNCDGEYVSETRLVNPQTARAKRRINAEKQLRKWAKKFRVNVCILRAPGIYSIDRLPFARLQEALPAISSEEDSYTNHIHADDLARICVATLWKGKGGRTFNATDEHSMKMGDYFDLVADYFNLPHPPRVSRENAQKSLPASLLSFMGESRRLTNSRLKKELRINLRYASVAAALRKI